MNALVKAFEKEPRTHIVEKQGSLTITVLARHIQPEIARACAFIGIFLPLMLIVIGIAMALFDENKGAALMPLAAGILGYVYLPGVFRDWGMVTTTVTFTEGAITVQRPPEIVTPPAPGIFDRQHPHRFVLYPHDKARGERDEIEYLNRTRPGARHPRYYENSFYVVLEYLGQRFDLAEVLGEREARAILDRLTLCDTIMNDAASTRRQLPTQAEDEWTGPTSSVPE